jgi:uncharacterized repeat protein (TIGR03809 family)
MHATPFFRQMVATMIESRARSRFDEVAHKWRVLAEKRRDQLVELHMSGRWSTYFEEQKFKRCMRDAADAVERWNAIAPRPAEPKLDLKVLNQVLAEVRPHRHNAAPRRF